MGYFVKMFNNLQTSCKLLMVKLLVTLYC